MIEQVFQLRVCAGRKSKVSKSQIPFNVGMWDYEKHNIGYMWCQSIQIESATAQDPNGCDL